MPLLRLFCTVEYGGSLLIYVVFRSRNLHMGLSRHQSYTLLRTGTNSLKWNENCVKAT